ncbi:MAG TPA: transglutaminaseTgpA domain-containing protein [Geobacteraceae bacterium]|nr:transglutaminaseTgpA domain-containing protein [Geobacteraceae bacterium]
MVKIKSVYTILIYCISLLGAIPVILHVDALARFLFVPAFGAGIFFDIKNRYHVKNSYLTIISVLFFLYFSFGFSGSNIVVPALNILLMLLSARLLGDKSERNCLQIVVLSLFALAGSSLLDLSMTFLFYLVFFMIFIAVFLVITSFGASDSEQAVSSQVLKKLLAVAVAMPALAFPLMIIFFVVIPRTEYPIWNFMNSSDRKTAGFSESMEPGSSASVDVVKKVVFRAESPKLADKNLYWRGIVMNSIQGNKWVRSGMEPKENDFAAKGEVVQQTIYPEPGMDRYVIALNVPVGISGVKTEKKSDCVFVGKDLRQERLKYISTSVLTGTIKVREGIDRTYYLRIPPQVSSRAISLAGKISGKGGTDAEKLQLLEKYFITGNFSYSTKNLRVAEDPVDAFLFSEKSGNCEFFAHSFAVLLRLMGIPSRLVGGYYGGEYNNIGGYYLVTEDMAHVWVEAFIDGTGWVTVDPTAFSSNFASKEKHSGKSVFWDIRLIIDSMGYYWNRAVISYDLDKQFRLLRITNDEVKKINLKLSMKNLSIFSIPVLLFILYLTIRKKYRYLSKEEKVLRNFLGKVRKKYPDVPVAPGTGLQEIVKIIDKDAVRQFADLYCGIVYRDRKMSGEEYQQLLKLAEKV